MTAAGPGVLFADRYRLGTRLAGGGMGDVWRAQDVVLDRAVAVKLLRAELTDDADFRLRFRGEARHAARLSHPGIASVYDFGELPDRAWLVLELVEGEALSELLRREGRLTPQRTLDIVRQAAEALQAAHANGVVHRDVKPGNLLVRRDGVVKVTDFGIASATGSVPLTRTGQIIGTAGYLSPEQAAGRTATAASDVYALGVVAYECLSGARPFVADTPVAVLFAHLHRPPPPLPDEIPAAVRGVVERLLAKDPADRPASAGELARELTGLQGGLPDTAARGSAGAAGVAGGSRRELTATTAAAATGAMSRRTQRRAVRATAVLLLALTAAVAVRGVLTDESTRVPDIPPGTAAAQAAATLVQAELDPAQEPQPSSSVAAGRVVALRPTAGSEVQPGAEVVLVVSSGPKPTAPKAVAPSASAQPPARQADPGPAAPAREQEAPVEAPVAGGGSGPDRAGPTRGEQDGDAVQEAAERAERAEEAREAEDAGKGAGEGAGEDAGKGEDEGEGTGEEAGEEPGKEAGKAAEKAAEEDASKSEGKGERKSKSEGKGKDR